MNVKAVTVNHLLEDQARFLRSESIEFDSMTNSFCVGGDRRNRSSGAGARIKNADVPVLTERQEPPNSLCFFL